MPSKLALITGASKGIGKAVALAAADAGLDVIATARNESELKSLQQTIQLKGGNCLIQTAELTNDVELQNIVGKLNKQDKKISLLVHSAGSANVGLVSEMELTKWRETIETNLSAPFYLTQKCLPLIEKGGHIIFINSVAGKQTFPEWSAYAASKFGLKALADTLRQELASRHIKVTSIYPTSVDTPMQDKLPYNWDRSKMLNAEIVAKAVIDCFLQPEEVMIKELEIENMAGTF